MRLTNNHKFLSRTGGMVDETTLVEVVSEHGPLSTEEVADIAGCSSRAADYRLRKLYADGAVESTTVGRSLRWWIANDVNENDHGSKSEA